MAATEQIEDSTNQNASTSNETDVMSSSWPASSKIGYGRLLESDTSDEDWDENDGAKNMANLMSSDGRFADADASNRIGNSNNQDEASNLSYLEMGYTHGWGHGKIWPQ